MCLRILRKGQNSVGTVYSGWAEQSVRAQESDQAIAYAAVAVNFTVRKGSKGNFVSMESIVEAQGMSGSWPQACVRHHDEQVEKCFHSSVS